MCMGKKKSSTLSLDDPHAASKEHLLGESSQQSHRDAERFASARVVQQRNKAKKVWCAIIALTVGILVFIGILAILRAVQDANNLFPTKRPVFPAQYEASVTMHLPYIDLVEPVYVHVDEDKGLQKLSYYGDTDVYIFNTSGPSYMIIPVVRELKCFRTDPQPLQHVFPNLSLFEPQHGVYLIEGRSCFGWKFTTKGSEPTEDGMLGEYTLYVDQETQEPVRYHFVGRNTMLGGSHIDEYYLDYHYVRAGPIDSHVFNALPSVMNCTNFSQFHGPTRTPAQDLHMLMPEGHGVKQQVFADFKDSHNKSYDDAQEESSRAAIFHQNLRYINAVNRQGLSYHLKPNRFADLSHEERVNMVKRPLVKRTPDNGADLLHEVSPYFNPPDEIDWRAKGAVTPVKDQGTCGSCWTYGTTGAIEGAIFAQEKKLYNLSQQVLMDCSWEFGNLACDGGLDYQAYAWVIASGGIEAEDTYGTYRNQPGFCHFNRSNAVAKMTGFVNVTSVEALNDALGRVGPLSVSIDATLPSFYFYGGGYYDDVKCKSGAEDLDHSVLAVGVTTHEGQKYTIVKNSWSQHWGEDGYVKISQKNNLCVLESSEARGTRREQGGKMVSTRSGSKQGSATPQATEPAKQAPVKRVAKDAPEGEAKPKKAAPANAEFSVGKAVTKDVVLLNQESKEVKFSDIYKDQGVVIFMYPRANTPGCTKQACGFRDHVQEIKDAGFGVYGLSADSPKSLANWKTKQSLSYDLLSDPKHELIKYFGSSIGGSKIQRSHVVILKGGVVGDIQGKVSPAESVDKAVDFVKKHGSTPAKEANPANESEAGEENKKDALEVGKKIAFNVELKNQANDTVHFQDLFKDQGAIFFMFPKADTPGCTVQARGFNDNIDEIRAAGFHVYGLSGDTPAELAEWKKKKDYAYDFLSDPKHELIKYFGSSLENGRVERSHVIICKGGEVGEIHHNSTPKDSFTRALNFAKSQTKSA
ncbi:TPA: hypothetical protein N0F65_011882 [Lagenidium giganteum]|uniref:thioredoxin-dependent peroxiredoxin n=1 Tax=Lagenidium giganteum TaxID=4803 RepID=A0AAV2YHE0_9STRA|nr:TPA: hypothetical protein N0F65_011882 [Lagenidium giganteum]